LSSTIEPSSVNPNFIKEEMLLANQEKRKEYLKKFSEINGAKL
jgi:hypothetical protein